MTQQKKRTTIIGLAVITPLLLILAFLTIQAENWLATVWPLTPQQQLQSLTAKEEMTSATRQDPLEYMRYPDGSYLKREEARTKIQAQKN